MKRFILIISLISVFSIGRAEVLQDFFQKLEQKTLESAFSLTMQDNATAPTTYTGTLTMHGEQFAVNVMGIEASYDGETLYSYSEDTDELTLSSPTQEELTEANPLLFAKALTDNCTTTTKEQNDKYVITLVPTDKSAGVQSFTLTLDKANLLPVSATMKESVSKQTTLTFKAPRYTQSKPSFLLQKEGAYLNDLR